MCKVVYIAAQRTLRLVAWDEQDPAFHVTPLDSNGEGVRQHLILPHLLAGSHQGCGCGFQYGQYPDAETDPEERRLAIRCRRELADYLRSALSAGDRVQMYACWSGDEGEPPLHHRRLSPADIDSKGFFFQEREVIDIVNPATALPS